MITVLNPAGYPPKIAAKALAPRLDTLNGRTVYLVDCRFDDSDVFLKQMQAWFAEHMPNVRTVFKPISSVYLVAEGWPRSRLVSFGGLRSYNPTMTVGTVERVLREFFVAQASEIIAVYLFGSVARGTASARSDIDVAVLYASAPPATLDGLPLDLEGRVEQLVKRPVQVIVLNPAPVGLVHRVLRDGVLLLDRDPSARIRFEVRARNEFFDLQPILARYRRRPIPAR